MLCLSWPSNRSPIDTGVVSKWRGQKTKAFIQQWTKCLDISLVDNRTQEWTMNMYESATYQTQSAVENDQIPIDFSRSLHLTWMMAVDTWAAFKVYLTQSHPRNSIACKLSQGFLCQETHSNISRIFVLSFDASWNLFFSCSGSLVSNQKKTYLPTCLMKKTWVETTHESTPWQTNMGTQIHEGLVQMFFLSKSLIFRFQQLVFCGESNTNNTFQILLMEEILHQLIW